MSGRRYRTGTLDGLNSVSSMRRHIRDATSPWKTLKGAWVSGRTPTSSHGVLGLRLGNPGDNHRLRPATGERQKVSRNQEKAQSAWRCSRSMSWLLTGTASRPNRYRCFLPARLHRCQTARVLTNVPAAIPSLRHAPYRTPGRLSQKAGIGSPSR